MSGQASWRRYASKNRWVGRAGEGKEHRARVWLLLGLWHHCCRFLTPSCLVRAHLWFPTGALPEGRKLSIGRRIFNTLAFLPLVSLLFVQSLFPVTRLSRVH